MGYTEDDRARDDIIYFNVKLLLQKIDPVPLPDPDPDETPVPELPPPDVRRFNLAGYTVSEVEPRRIYNVAIPRGTYTLLRYSYTLENFVFPAKAKSVIGAFAFHGSDFFLGQQVIKLVGRVVIVHAAGIPKGGISTSLPSGLRFGKDPIKVVHECDLKTTLVSSWISNEDETHVKHCPSVRAELDSFRVGGKGMQFRLSQHTNHEKEDGIAQERPAIGSRYTNVWLEVG